MRHGAAKISASPFLHIIIPFSVGHDWLLISLKLLLKKLRASDCSFYHIAIVIENCHKEIPFNDLFLNNRNVFGCFEGFVAYNQCSCLCWALCFTCRWLLPYCFLTYTSLTVHVSLQNLYGLVPDLWFI